MNHHLAQFFLIGLALFLWSWAFAFYGVRGKRNDWIASLGLMMAGLILVAIAAGWFIFDGITGANLG